MAIVLGHNQYGKAETHVVRVVRDTARHEIRDLVVSSALRGSFEDAHLTGDQSAVGEEDAETQLYRKAIQTVAESQKASTSYIQRQLRIGYNSAARLIERMEKDGLVGAPDHVGRRDVLIDTEGHPI